MPAWLKKIFSWISFHPQIWIWLGVAVVVAVILWRFLSMDGLIGTMMEEQQTMEARHMADLEALRTTYETERVAQEAINARLKENLLRVETEYNDRLSELETRTRTRRAAVVRETGGDPNEMARRLSERLGWAHE